VAEARRCAANQSLHVGNLMYICDLLHWGSRSAINVAQSRAGDGAAGTAGALSASSWPRIKSVQPEREPPSDSCCTTGGRNFKSGAALGPRDSPLTIAVPPPKLRPTMVFITKQSCVRTKECSTPFSAESCFSSPSWPGGVTGWKAGGDQQQGLPPPWWLLLHKTGRKVPAYTSMLLHTSVAGDV
jgi:hypothetical protein